MGGNSRLVLAEKTWVKEKCSCHTGETRTNQPRGWGGSGLPGYGPGSCSKLERIPLGCVLQITIYDETMSSGSSSTVRMTTTNCMCYRTWCLHTPAWSGPDEGRRCGRAHGAGRRTVSSAGSVMAALLGGICTDVLRVLALVRMEEHLSGQQMATEQ